MGRMIGVGDNTVDTYIHLRTLFPGGNTVNVPVLAKRLGWEAAYIGWLGQDERGELILSALQAEGLDVSHCRVLDTTPTAFSTVELVDGDRVFGPSDPGASQFIHLEPEDFDFIRTFDVVHVSVYSFLESQLPELKKVSKVLAFDLSQRHDQEYLELVLPHVDIVFISLSDVNPEDMEPLMRKMYNMGPHLVVATRGKHGSWVFDGSKIYHQGIIPVEAVDSLGAGDAFAACLLVEINDGTPIPQAMLRAAQFAADNCTHYGAFGYGKRY